MKKITLLLAMLFFSTVGFSQFTEDFESGVPGNFIETQDAEAVAWGSCGGSLGSQTCPISGSTSATFYRASTTPALTSLETPVMDLSAGGYQLTFDHSQEDWLGDQNTLLVEVSVDGGGSYTTIEDFTADMPSVVSESYTLDSFVALTATTVVRFTGTSVYGYSIVLDNVVVQPVPACLAPNSLTATNITATSADLGWTSGGSGEADWEIVVQAAGSGVPGGAGTSTGGANPYTDNTLSPSTDYEFYVRADCGGSGFSTWAGPYPFTTACATFTPDYSEDFTTFLPNCWEEGNNTDVATGPDGNNGEWLSDDYLNNAANGSAARINLWNTGDQDWLVSPIFDLSADGYELKFDVGVTVFGGTGASAMGSDDEVQVLISNDNGATWINLDTFNAANTPSNTGDVMTYDLTGYTSTTTKFAFWGSEGAIDDTEDYDFFIDNFIVRTPPACLEPTVLTATNITATSADLGWTSGGSGEADWEIVVQAAGSGMPGGAGTSTGGLNPYTDNSLSPATNYEFYVRADCGGSGFSAWSGPFPFTTLCGTVVPSYVNDFSAFPGACWEEGNNTDIATGPDGNDGAWTTDDYLNNAANGQAAKINLWNTGDQDWIVSPTFDLSAGGYGMKVDVGVTVFAGTGASAMGSDDEVQVLISNDDGATWINLETFNAGNTPSNTGDEKIYDLSAYTSATTKFAFWGTEGTTDDAEDYDFYVDNFTVDALATLGVEQLNVLEDFKYYPNPVKNELTVEAKNNIEQLQLVNMLGQTVKSVTPNSKTYQLNIADLPSGIYFVKASINNTEGTFRIVKQ